MASYVDVANNAASAIGEDDQLAAPDDDTHLGRTVAAVWDMARKFTIRKHSWNFAKQTVRLAALATPPISSEWASAYQVPADNLRLLRVHGCSRHHFAVQGKTILANVTGSLTIDYIRDMPEPALWDDLFAEAFAFYLAFKIADRITGDRSRKSDAWDSYKAAVVDAIKANAIENPPIEQGDTPWEETRLAFRGGDGWYPRAGTRAVWDD